MPKVDEAAVLVVGQVMQVSQSTDFNTKQPDGHKVLVSTGDGFASVKIKPDHGIGVPVPGQAVAWFIRYGASGSQGGGATAWTQFLYECKPEHLDNIGRQLAGRKAA